MKALHKWIPLVLRLFTSIILFLVLSLFITGCGTVRKVKDKSVETTEAKEVEQTKTKTVITEKLDTTITVKGDTAKASKQVDAFMLGDTIEAETNGTKVKAWYNPTTRKVHAEGITEPKQVAVTINKTTTTETDNKRTVEVEHKSELLHTSHERSLLYSNFWIWFVLIGLAALAYFLWRWKPPFL
jgi:uncharacterized lipoprotein YehR (DUF1307 family)